MQPTDIRPWDWHRIFLGELEWWFTLEILFRTAIMYAFAILLVRLVSRRAVGQLSLVEFMLVIALGSAVGDPMFYPEVPIVHGMVVMAGIILLYRGLIELINRVEPVETWVEGHPVWLIREGRLLPDGLDDATLNREKLFELLRREGVRHLGEVDHAFQEQGGEITVFKRSESETRPGLRVMPPWDLEPPVEIEPGCPPGEESWMACRRCGKVSFCPEGVDVASCEDCGGHVWVDAVEGVPEPGGSVYSRP